MQSTLPTALLELSGTRKYLSDCMSGLYESADSQAETAGRVPELAGFTVMQQSRRMMQRPLSIQGVELADGKRFFINLGSQAETCARPMMFNDAMLRPASSNGTLLIPVLLDTSMRRPITNNKQTKSEDMTMAVATNSTQSATNTTPFAWDFRANSVDALSSSTERNFDWPSLDESEYRRPELQHQAKIWSKEPSYSRLPAAAIKAKRSAADAESLRELLHEAMEREAQRVTVRTAKAETKSNSKVKSALKVKQAFVMISNMLSSCVRNFNLVLSPTK